MAPLLTSQGQCKEHPHTRTAGTLSGSEAPSSPSHIFLISRVSRGRLRMLVHLQHPSDVAESSWARGVCFWLATRVWTLGFMQERFALGAQVAWRG